MQCLETSCNVRNDVELSTKSRSEQHELELQKLTETERLQPWHDVNDVQVGHLGGKEDENLMVRGRVPTVPKMT